MAPPGWQQVPDVASLLRRLDVLIALHAVATAAGVAAFVAIVLFLILFWPFAIIFLVAMLLIGGLLALLPGVVLAGIPLTLLVNLVRMRRQLARTGRPPRSTSATLRLLMVCGWVGFAVLFVLSLVNTMAALIAGDDCPGPDGWSLPPAIGDCEPPPEGGGGVEWDLRTFVILGLGLLGGIVAVLARRLRHSLLLLASQRLPPPGRLPRPSALSPGFVPAHDGGLGSRPGHAGPRIAARPPDVRRRP